MGTPSRDPSLSVHDLDRLRQELTTLMTLGVGRKEILAMLQAQQAPGEALLEALLVLGRPASPLDIARVLLKVAVARPLLEFVPAACRRWGIHPASLVALYTRGPLSLGKGLGLPEALVRSFPGMRPAEQNTGLWEPPRDFAGPTLPERLALCVLSLRDQPRLEVLPERLWVEEAVTLDRLPRLRAWQGALEAFQGDLIVRDCPALPPPRLPLPLENLILDGHDLAAYPDHPLRVRHNLALFRMPNLRALDPELEARHLLVAHCAALADIPHLPNLGHDATEYPGSFNLFGWRTAGTYIPQEAYCQRGLTLRDLPALRTLPDGFKVPGKLILQGCRSFDRLPEGLQVDTLVLRGLPALRSLPENLRVARHLVLDRLPNLASLPPGLQVGGDLVIPRASHIPRPHPDLQVGGSLWIHPADDGPHWPAVRRKHPDPEAVRNL